MKTSQGMFFVALYLAVAANAVAAEKSELNTEVDPSAAPTVETEQQEQAAETGFAVHGVGYLSFKAAEGDQAGLNLFLAQGEFRWTNGTWGAYATPRLKIEPVGTPDSQGNLFFQQAYGYYRHDYGQVKVGKIYQRLGRLWDFGFYGPLLGNYEIKQQPDLGVSLEGAPRIADDLNLEYDAQYFVADGRSISVGNSTFLSGANVRHRNIVVLRVAPTYHFDTSGTVALGVSGERFDVVPGTPHQVLRGAVDADLVWGPWNGFAELGRQDGDDIVYNSAYGVTSHNYFFVGAMYKRESFNVRYHFNIMRYDAGYIEYLHQPGGEYNFNDHLGLIVEGAWWESASPQYAAEQGHVERSIYIVADAKF